MQNREQTLFVLNSEPFPININNNSLSVLTSINNDISVCLFQNHVYYVQSNVSSEVFQSFINYLFHVNTEVPNITPQNVDQYYLLNQEFQSDSMRNLIESQRGTFNELTVNLLNLNNPLIRDKTLIEQSIAHNLDAYVTERGDELISSPINSLFLILTNRDLVFTQYDLLYELIIREHQRTNNLSIFCLLSTFQLSQLSPENQRDSIEQQYLRGGMIPKPDILSMINEIERQKQEINNYERTSLIFIRNHILSLHGDHGIDESQILDACKRGDIDTISRFLNNDIEEGCFTYRLNLSDHTAKIIHIRCEMNREELIIPRSVNYRNIEFIITSVEKRAICYIRIRNIVFPEDSQVRFIHQEVIVGDFETIKLPPLLEHFSLLYVQSVRFANILLWPNSRYINKINDQLLIEKSDLNSDVFDVLLSANRNVQTVTIPDYITKISENAFRECYDLEEIIFSENSQLQIIESNAFVRLKIERITIPSHVRQICEYAFNDCRRLKTVNFAPNCEISIFRKSMFHGCSIENLIIPCNVKELQPGWHDGVNIDSSNVSVSPENHNLLFLNEKMILGKTIENSDNYDIVLFACRNIEEENIPDFVRIIGPYAFSKCKRLRTIHFSENSQLTTISEGSFDQSSLQTITIPSHVQEISRFSFSKCNNLIINFAPNSELHSFDAKAFSETTINSLFIPRNINDIQSMFKEIKSIGRFLISPENHNFLSLNEKFLLGKTNQNSNDFDVIVFASNNCTDENIPDNIKKICSYAFSKCRRLIKVNFSENSQLSIIDSYAFFESSLNEIMIPRNVTEIHERAFSRCRSLESFQFHPNSNLRIIGDSCFLSSSIHSISIPSSVTTIQNNAFSDSELHTIVFPEDSQLQYVGNHLFYSTSIQNATIPQRLAGIININQ